MSDLTPEALDAMEKIALASAGIDELLEDI